MNDQFTCEHKRFKVYIDESDNIFIGICLDCGAYQELEIRKIEEVFNHV